MTNKIEIKVSVDGTAARAELMALSNEARRSGNSANSSSTEWGKLGKSIALALSPSLIPIAGGVAAGVGLIGASLGPTIVATGLFGAMAKTVMSGVGQDATKLADLQSKLADATTAKQKASIQRQIGDLEKGWSTAHETLVGEVSGIQGEWKKLSSSVATQPLIDWLFVVQEALSHLKPLVQPVADVFDKWGYSLSEYFDSGKGSAEITKIATAVGKFAGTQLQDLGTFFIGLGKGVANLAQDVAGHNVDFGTFGKHLAEWGDAFAKWSSSSAARQDVTKFLDWLHTSGEKVSGIVRSLATALPSIMKGLAGAGAIQLSGIGAFFTVLSKLPASTLTTLAQLLPEIILGVKGWALAQGILNIALDANPIGLIVTGLGLLVGAFLIAWQHSETFREIVTKAFSGLAVAVLTFAEIFLTEMQVIANIFLTTVGLIVHGAADAFGWVPGVGGKLKAAAAAFDGFKQDVNNVFNAAHAKIEGWKTDLTNMPKVVKLEGNISDLTSKLNNAKAQLRDPNLTATRRAQIEANISQLEAQIAAAKAQLAAINGRTATTYVNTVYYNTQTGEIGKIGGHTATGGTIPHAASGGARGSLTMVGEHGPELVRLPGGSTVYSNPDTGRVLSQGGGGVASVQLVVDPTGQNKFQSFMLDMIREFVRTQGGGNVQTAFGRR